MPANEEYENNVTVLPIANAKRASAVNKPDFPRDVAVEVSGGASAGQRANTKSGTAQIEAGSSPAAFNVFAFPGGYSDASTERIARRLCDHMNLNYNLCCQLEHIADSLPGSVDRQECLHVAKSIIPVVKLAHEFEETVLFPLLRENFDTETDLEHTLDRLQGEHWEDESYASEVYNGLIEFVSELADSNVESLGYMLRGFFEGMRRHLAFEREHVLPLLRRIDAAT